MKVFVCLVLVAFAALAQGRSANFKVSTKEAAVAGEEPYILHLRVVRSDGTLHSCAGSLVDHRWAVTAASCISDARFIWVRYEALRVANPALVTETSAVTLHPEFEGAANNIGIISLNRHVEYTDKIRAVELASDAPEGEERTRFCSWGLTADGGNAEQLTCSELTTRPSGDSDSILAEGEAACTADIGSPLVVGGQQVGVLNFRPSGCGSGGDDGVAVSGFAAFTSVGPYLDWISEVTGVDLSRRVISETVKVASL